MTNNAFKALAHPVRRGIVERLAGGRASVGAASHGLGVSKPAISRHLKVLVGAGVVKRTISGRTHFLDLDASALGEAGTWIDQQRARWDRMFDAVEDRIAEQQGRK